MIGTLTGPTARQLWRIAVPVTLQTVVFSSKSIVDAAMLGSQAEVDVAAIGIAGRATFVVTIFLVGFTIGGAQVGAQVWGRRDADRERPLRQTVWLTWATASVCGLLACLAFLTVPEQVVALGTDSPTVVGRGAEFLRVVAPTFLLFCWTSSVAAGLRVMRQPGVATLWAVAGVVLNVGLNAVLIFGLLGAPALGIVGAAYGTLASAVVETAGLALHLRLRRHALSRFPRAELRAIRAPQVRRLLTLSLPAAGNSTLWALGSFAFYALVGSTGLSAAAALAVLSPVESLALAFTIGLANAAAVVVGGSIGAGDLTGAYRQARLLVAGSVVVGLGTAVLTWALKSPLLALFPELSPATRDLTGDMFDLMAAGFVLKSVGMVMVLGVLRAGGEVRFCLLLDAGAQWGLLLPVAWLLRDVAGASALVLFAVPLLEEAVRIVVAGARIRSRRWLRDLVVT
ncbi:putative MATE family efflux protein [Isoptericola jiangsuensis]|uniref:Putative MATE family efflux protein n=1 Tax=Isoptericola jiangsuensis TaxID=548579 RepID=A0A2A9F2X4_9MICO|nr:MATE family efflux transporter [Isoptericola jiangsuensis]PFG44860.1 putative MATE family efflux protein [Isoptericola jiangsuensis]